MFSDTTLAIPYTLFYLNLNLNCVNYFEVECQLFWSEVAIILIILGA